MGGINHERRNSQARYGRSQSFDRDKALAKREAGGLAQYQERSAEVPEASRLYLRVPYAQRLEAKKLGCVWDKNRKQWWTRAAAETSPGNWLIEPRAVEQTAPERARGKYKQTVAHWSEAEAANRLIDLTVSEGN